MIAFGPIPSRRLGKSLGVSRIGCNIYNYKFGNKTLDMLIDTTTYYRQKLFEITRELV